MSRIASGKRHGGGRRLIAVMTAGWLVLLAVPCVLMNFASDDPNEPFGLLDIGLLAFAGLFVAGPVVIAVTAATRGLRVTAALYGLLAVVAVAVTFAALTGRMPGNV
ncbi:MAG: hypothetical protein JWO79_92 [Actinomycetia bacterium]|nr:hypothetical protein [Actinomycetes bacterium]